MNRRDLINKVSSVMKENGMGKSMTIPKQVFHISDDEGNTRNFIVKKSDKRVPFTYGDIDAMMSVLEAVIEDALKQGEPVSIRGFGTLALHHRKARSTKHPVTGEPVVVPGRYIPKFTYGNDLRMCAKIFELALEDGILTNTDETYEDGEE